MAIPNRIARLNSNGSTDTSFSPSAGLNAEGLCVGVDAAGRVAAGGAFTMVGDFLRAKLAFFESDGELIGDTPTPSDAVRTLVTQASGETLFGGDFTSVSGTTRNRIARITPDLSLEAGFNPNASAAVNALALQTDGKILAGGTFTSIGGTTRNRIARLYNGVASDRLYAVTPSLIRWDRTGTNEKTQRVTFEIDTGSGYGPLAGVVSQISTGWQIIPSTPLSGATNNVRATAYPSDSHSGGTQQTVASIPIIPEIAVTINDVVMEDGVSNVTFPSLQVGATSTATVTISNEGLDTLTLTSGVTIDGQWEIVSQPATSIPSLANVSFDIRFEPTDEGAKTGTLSIFSNDATEATFTVNLSGDATAGPGGLDLTWQPGANRGVRALAKASNDSVWVGGDFTTVKSLIRQRLALTYVDAQGRLQLRPQAANIFPVIPSGISCIAQLPDGTVLAGNTNTNKIYWVGFASTGEVILKSSFDILPDTNFTNPVTYLNCMAVQADGKVLIGGYFLGIKVGRVTKRGKLVRLIFSSAGAVSFDDAFSAGLTDQEVRGIAIQTDGKIVLAHGPGASPGARSGVIRLTDVGERDATFSSVAYGMGRIALDTQGRVFVSGVNSSVGVTPAAGVSRLSPLGVLDGTFSLVPSAATALLPMVDGTLVVASESFGALASTSRLEKILTDGTADASFVSAITGTVLTVCSQENGALLIGGSFGTSAGPFTSARLINSAVSASLTVVDATRVQWLRSGALPETQVVVFDVSQDNGATWLRFGQGQRIAGGWQLTGISLPASGILRARAYIQSAGNSSIMEDQVRFSGLDVADLIVQTPGANGPEIVADDGTAETVSILAGNALPVVVTLTNTGRASMTNVVATVTPTTSLVGDPRWTINAAPNGTIVAGGSTTTTVNFKPINSDRGLISAVLNIASSVPGLKNPYRITLVGAAVNPPVVQDPTVQLESSGDVIFRGRFNPNDLEATVYFRYGLRSADESTWATTSPATLSGFALNQMFEQPVSGLPLGALYAVKAYITNSSNVTSPASSNRVNFVPQL